MNYALVKQETYPAPIDGLFIIKISKAEFNPILNKIDMDITNNDYIKVIGDEFVVDFQNYKIITIMKDIPTGDYFALCKLLMTPESDKID